MRLYPKYKLKDKLALAWLFIALAEIEIYEEKPTIKIKHLSRDFIHRFMQLVRLGTVRSPYQSNIIEWQLTEPQEIPFFLNSIIPFIRCQQHKRVAKLILQLIEKPDPEITMQIRKATRKRPLHYVDF